MGCNLRIQRKAYRLEVGLSKGTETYCKLNNEMFSNLGAYGYSYASIVHDRDGDYKHLHLVVISNTRVQAQKVLTNVSECFLCNVDNVGIMECPNIYGAIQYLVHKNNPEKFQYSTHDIISNIESNRLLEYLETPLGDTTLSSTTLIELCEQYKNDKLSLIQVIGLGNYNCYRNTINDILDELGVKRIKGSK